MCVGLLVGAKDRGEKDEWDVTVNETLWTAQNGSVRATEGDKRMVYKDM